MIQRTFAGMLTRYVKSVHILILDFVHGRGSLHPHEADSHDLRIEPRLGRQAAAW